MANTPAGFTPVAQTDTFDPAADINRAELFVEDLIKPTSATVSALSTDWPSPPFPGFRVWVTAAGCFYVWNGTVWSVGGFGVWTSYTPTVGSLAVGSGGTVTGKYRLEAQGVHGVIVATLGSTGFTVGTIPTFSLPVAAASPAFSNAGILGNVMFRDSSATQVYRGDIGFNGTDPSTLRVLAFPGVAGVASAVTATAPFTWAAGDQFLIEFVYPTA